MKIRSPGMRVKWWDRSAMICATEKIMSPVLELCRVWPFTWLEMSWAVGSSSPGGHQTGADGGKAVEGLGQQPLAAPGKLQVPGGQVVAAGIAVDIVQGLVHRHIPGGGGPMTTTSSAS